jgi:hypothetical protein
VLVALVVLLLPLPARSQCTCDGGDGQFAINQSIVLDGSMADWATVLADPDNNTCDGGQPDIEPQPDRDHPVQSTGRDLVHFAWTWNAFGVSTYTGRVASSSNVQRFIYYGDTDNDGSLETGEPIVVAQWKGSNRKVELFLGAYVEDAPGGDPMVDGDGYGDGYRLPGTAMGFPPPGQPDYDGDWGSSDGLVMEWAVPWSDLGVPEGTAMTFHVSATNSQPGSSSFPEQIDDNLGGCGGGNGTMQYAGVTFVPDRSLEGNLGETVYAAHTLTNTGNGADVFDLTSEVTGDHTPGITYYDDADGSGTLTPGDVLLTDSDADGIPDSGVLAAGEVLDVLIGYAIGGSSAGTASVTTTATSSFDGTVSDHVDDTVTVLAPDIVVVKSTLTHSDPVNGTTNPKAIPGAVVYYLVQVSNTGSGATDTDTVILSDSVPQKSVLFVGDIGGAGSGPIVFTDGATPSGLSYTFVSLDSTTDDVEFSDDDGATFSYVPQPDANGFDADVTDVRVLPKGSFDASDGVNDPSFSTLFRIAVE